MLRQLCTDPSSIGQSADPKTTTGRHRYKVACYPGSALKHSSHVNMILVCFPFIKGMPGVLEKVLDYLDHQSLSNTHQVCKQWNDAVIRSRCWRRQLLHKVWQSLNLLT